MNNKPFLVKTLVVALLALALLVPIAMIRDLVSERQARRNEAVSGIAEGWGKRQSVATPYIVLPYQRHWLEGNMEKSESRTVRLHATAVEWNVSAEISEKARGIYKARLYGARVEAHGTIAIPARASLEDGSSRYKWGTPRLVVSIADPLGIRAAPDIEVAGNTYLLAANSGDSVPGVHALLHGLAPAGDQALRFVLALELGGSEAFAVSPLGADTTLTMRADWPHPSFQGRFLPLRHDVSASGFSASWKVSRFAAQGGAQPAEQISVSFVEPAGLYQRLERASKYGFLFIGLTFAAFVLFELLRRLAIHPVQYGLVGLALAMFFLLLTALSEHIHFGAAYTLATAACVGLITAYVARVLQSTRLALAFGAALGGLYAILYALLQAEDYALLGGTLVLFGLLAAVMLATRRVDWYRLIDFKKEQPC